MELTSPEAVMMTCRIRVGGACLLTLVLGGAAHMSAQAVRTSSEGAPALDVASIKPSASPGPMRMRASPGRVDITGATLRELIANAYGEPTPIPPYRVSGTLPWMETDRFDIMATLVDGAPALTPTSTRLAVRRLLVDRFKVSVRTDPRDGPAYLLTLAKESVTGAQLKPTELTCQADPATPFPLRPCDAIRIKGGQQFVMDGTGVTMAQLAGQLGAIPAIGRLVADRTGLPGRYDFTLTWAPPATAPDGAPTADNVPRDVGPSIFAALEEQLGMKLEPGRGTVETLIIETAERPAAN
jgi:bla regulator protein BlaR1